jgi:HEAT repeat protein
MERIGRKLRIVSAAGGAAWRGRLLAVWLWPAIAGAAGAGNEAWKSQDPDEVCGAINALKGEDSEAARSVLTSLLGHGQPAVREEAAWAFCDAPWTNALPKLRELAARDAHEGVRAAAVMALGESRDPRCLPLLRAALSDRGGRVRARAAMALEQFADAESVEPLLAALRDGDNEVVFCSIRALARRKDDRVVPALLPFLAHQQRKIRVAAAHGIARATGRGGLAEDPALETAEGGAALRDRLRAWCSTNGAAPGTGQPAARRN